MNIKGFVVIGGSMLSANAAKMLDHYQHQNELLMKQDLDNEMAFKAYQDSLAVDLDDYRTSGRAWKDYVSAFERAVSYEPNKILGFIPWGQTQKFNSVACYKELTSVNDNFWRHISIFILDELSEHYVTKFRDYYLGKHPAYTKKFGVDFLKGLIGLDDRDKVYLSLKDYQTYKKWWDSYRTADGDQTFGLLTELAGIV